MDPSNSNEQLKRTLSRNQILLIGVVIFAAIAALLLYFFIAQPKPMNYMSDPPPIIVKSGSFDMETDKDLTITGGNGSDPEIVIYPDLTASYVRIDRYNKDNSTLQDLYDGTIVTVKIWMEDPDGNMSANPNFILEKIGDNFRLTSTEKLKKVKNKHAKRPYKIKDKDGKEFRFGKIQIGSGSEIPAVDGDEFFLKYYRPFTR